MIKLLLFLQTLLFLTNRVNAVIVGIDQLTAKNNDIPVRQVTLFHDYHTLKPDLENPQLIVLKNVFTTREQQTNSEPLHVFVEEPSQSYKILGNNVLSSIGDELKSTCQKTTTENIEIRCVAKVALQLFGPEANPHTIFNVMPYLLLPTVNSAFRTMKLDEPYIQDLCDEFKLFNDEILLWKNTLPEHMSNVVDNYVTQHHMLASYKNYQKLLKIYDPQTKIIDIAKKLYLQDRESSYKLYESINSLFSHLLNVYTCMRILSKKDSRNLALFLGASHAMWVRALLQDLSLYDCSYSVASNYHEDNVKPLNSKYIYTAYTTNSWIDNAWKIFNCCTIQ